MKLLLADDHRLFRDALVQYIVRSQPDANIQIAEDLPGALEVLKKDSQQDLVLLDLRMPGMSGLQGFKTMKEKFPDIPVALMSGVAEAQDVENAMNLGAVGYFPKTLSGKALLQGIQHVLAGETFMPSDEIGQNPMPSYYDDGGKANIVNLNGGAATETMESANINLTQREREVLAFLMRGASNKEIANALGLQLVTVKLHVRGVCRKLDAKNRTQAAMKAQALGFGHQ